LIGNNIMKKYKLIQKYPSLARDWEPGMEVGTGDRNYGYSPCSGNYTDCRKLDNTEVENNPEYWQEVVDHGFEIMTFNYKGELYKKNEQGYATETSFTHSLESHLEDGVSEIHSVKRISDGEIFTVGDLIKTPSLACTRITGFNTDYSNEYFIEIPTGFTRLLNLEKVIERDYEILSYLKKGSTKCITTKKRGGEKHEEFWSIHSVKRLSDGEVFTVGDKVKVTEYGSIKNVDGFTIRNGISFLKEGAWIFYDKGMTHLDGVKKAKQPIFLTHDGKDIFNGDTIWYVNKENFYYDYIIPHSEVKFYSDLNAYFLTREEAEDYIKRNKVLFTTEDGVEIKHGDTYYFVDTDFNINTSKANFQAVAMSDKRKYFSTVEEAHEYVMQNVKALSIKDFWEITCMSTSNFNKSTYMKGLVKKALGIK
jgi:hypothetical protein